MQLMTEDQSGKRPPLTLPVFGKGLETNILSEDNAAEFIGPLQKLFIRQGFGAIFDCG